MLPLLTYSHFQPEGPCSHHQDLSREEVIVSTWQTTAASAELSVHLLLDRPWGKWWLKRFCRISPRRRVTGGLDHLSSAVVQLPVGQLRRKGWGRAAAGWTSEPSRSSRVYPVQGRWKLHVFHGIQFHSKITQNSYVCPWKCLLWDMSGIIKNRRWGKERISMASVRPQMLWCLVSYIKELVLEILPQVSKISFLGRLW